MEVSDAKLYYYLLRVAVVAYQQERRAPPTAEAPANFDPLPKHTLKTLMGKFNAMAMAPSSESEDGNLRRSYLAFYGILLQLKKTEPESYEEFKTRVDLLILRFISCSSKELGKNPDFKDRFNRTQAVNHQTIAFISLLTSVARQINAKSPLVAQLEKYQTAQEKNAREVEQLSYDPKNMEVVRSLKHVLSDIVLTDQMLQEDINKNIDLNPRYELSAYITALKSNVHPVYTRQDLNESWESWKEQEIAATQKIIDGLKQSGSKTTESLIIPPDPKAYFLKTLQQCLKADISEPVILSPKSRKLLSLCCTYWRIPQNTYAALVLQCGRSIYKMDPTRVDYLTDCFTFVEHLADCALPSQWPHADAEIALATVNELKIMTMQAISSALKQMLQDKPPKLGPYIQLFDDHLVSWSGSGMTDRFLGVLKKSIFTAAETSYDQMLKKIPRDETLDLLHISELGDGVISIAKKLQKRYQMPLFDELPIAKLVCSRQLRLFGIDFVPMFNYCIEGHKSRGQEPNFDEVIQLYQTMSTLQNLYEQVSISESFNFDVEKLFYPFMVDWAKSSAQLAKSWVAPAIEHDNFHPLDADANIMYSTSVKDLFNSFSASLQVVQSVSWENQYHVAKVYTQLIQGIGEACSLWVQKLRNNFIYDLSQVEVRPMSTQSKWLEMAKETIQGQHTNPPEPFNFKTETLVYLNDVDAAHDRLFKMEEALDSDAIARRIEVEEKKKRQEASSYLYAINIVRAQDLAPDENKGTRDAYVTLIDEMARKKIGRTRTVYENLNPVWNQRFELETNSRSQNLKLMVWDENQNSNHGLCGTAYIKLDAKQFQHKEWGTIFKTATLERQHSGQPGLIDVQIIMDVEREDIRFYFGKALRFLQQTKTEMIELIVEKFSNFITASISLNTINIVLNRSKFNLSSWLPASAQKSQMPLSQEQVEDTLNPLFDYLNRNFAMLASVLTDDLRILVMTETWKVTLRTIETLLLARLEKRKHVQAQLDSAQMDIVYTWLRALRDFFHNDGVGPSLEALQDRMYQKIMSIPVYYDMTTVQLRQECDKITKSSLKQFSTTIDLVSRQRTVMAHRNRRVIESQEAEIRKAHMATLDIDKDDILLRILRMRKDDEFIDRQLEYRKRIEIKASTERALAGY